MNCPKCNGPTIVFSTTRRLHYKVEGIDSEGDLRLGDLVEEEEVEEGKGDRFSCADCEHEWPVKPAKE